MLKLKQICKTAVLCAAALVCAAPAAAQQEGGKKRIGVAAFENHNQALAALGGRMADMLVSGLVQNRNYELIERSQLNKVMEEQGLGMTGVLDQSNVAQVGKIAGLDYIVLGSILEAKADEKASKAGAVAGAVTGAIAGRLLGNSGRSRLGDAVNEGITDASSGASYTTDYSISITVKVVEVETGRILLTQDASASDSHKYGKTKHVTTADDFSKIAKEAVDKVSNQIVWELDPLEPAVLMVEGNELTIDKGRRDGITQGQQFTIVREGDPIHDLSGNLVGVKTLELGVIEIIRAEPATAVGRVLTINQDPATKQNYEIKRGDLSKIRFGDANAAESGRRRRR